MWTYFLKYGHNLESLEEGEIALLIDYYILKGIQTLTDKGIDCFMYISGGQIASVG
jgi:hypothetical protein